MAFVVVVTRRALGLEALMENGSPPNLSNPFVLRLDAGLDRARLVLFRMLDDVPNVMRLLVERVRKVRGDSVLQRPHMEAVGEAVAEEAMQRLHPVGPVIGKRSASASIDLKARATRVGGADLESGC